MGDVADLHTSDFEIRADEWENVVLGMGGEKDPSAFTEFRRRGTIDDVTLESLYVQEHFAAAIVENKPKDSIRAGWDLQIAGDPLASAELREPYEKEEERLSVVKHMTDGSYWGRAFGGAVTWMGADDGRDPKLPLAKDRIRSVRFLHTFDRRDVEIETYYQDPEHPKFREPRTYRLRPQIISGAAGFGFTNRMLARFGIRDRLNVTVGRGVLVHESRIVVWPGQPTTDTRRIELIGWDDSVLERAWTPLKQLGEDYAAKSSILGRISQAVYKIKHLWAMLAGKRTEQLKNRLDMMEATRSRGRAMVLDTDEDFINVTQPIAGIDGLLDKSTLRVAAAADQPVAIFMGQSPAGLGTPEGDQEVWSAELEAWRTHVLKPRHARIAEVILLAKDGPVGGSPPDGWRIVYRPLRVPSQKEAAEVRKLDAEADALNIKMGVYSAEVAAARYGPDGRSDVILDTKELASRIKRREELVNQPPKDNAELGTLGPRAASVLEVLEQVNTGKISRESGMSILTVVHRYTPEDAAELLGPEDFAPERKPPPVVGVPGAPPPAPPGPNPDPQSGQGAGAPEGLPGFSDGGNPDRDE